ncbi:MAG: ATP-binding protein [Lachnospiraceae bacterium]|nr:ATP-binding protein [Lachnospiraceae bacterium]
MDIVVLFERVSLNDIKGDKELLYNDLYMAGRLLDIEKKDADINLKLLEERLPNSPDREKIAIIVSSNKMKSNMGKRIVNFKTSAIKSLVRAGVAVDKDSLSVKLNDSCDVDELIRKESVLRSKGNNSNYDEFDYEQKSKQYIPVEPLYSFDRVILPADVLEKIEEAVGILECENKVFNEWGLYEIQPHPSTSLSFYGPSGTGKTMAAEAIAHKLGKKILKVSYADVESKYHGEGPKMVKAIFLAAKKNDSVLFFDEADSLLSKRLTSVSQGSEQAINSMRSQLLICLEEFRGIVIFATNLIVNYDQAFLTRLISVEFKVPDEKTRKKIWDVHIKPLDDGEIHILNIPLAQDVDTEVLAQKYEFAGREIRNAVVSACVSAALAKQNIVYQNDFVNACERIEIEKKALREATDHTKSSDLLKKALAEKLKKKEEKGEKEDVSTLIE